MHPLDEIDYKNLTRPDVADLFSWAKTSLREEAVDSFFNSVRERLVQCESPHTQFWDLLVGKPIIIEERTGEKKKLRFLFEPGAIAILLATGLPVRIKARELRKGFDGEKEDWYFVELSDGRKDWRPRSKLKAVDSD